MEELQERGVKVTRRASLHGAWALPSAWAVARWARGRAADGVAGGGGGADVDAFLADWTRRADAAVASEAPNEEALLFGLCEALAELDRDAFPRRARDAYQGNGVTSGPFHAEGAFLALEFELEPDAVIRPHNHVGWSFCSLGVGGEAHVAHYEVEGSAPEPGEERDVDFLVREVSATLLRPGRTSTLSRGRANIHAFQAGPQGARFLDFGIHYPDPGPGPESFSVLEIASEPVDGQRRLHKSRWLGNVYAKED